MNEWEERIKSLEIERARPVPYINHYYEPISPRQGRANYRALLSSIGALTDSELAAVKELTDSPAKPQPRL